VLDRTLDWIQRLPLWPVVGMYLVVSLLAAVLVRNALKRSIETARPRMEPKLYMVLHASLPRPAGGAFFLFAISAGLRWIELPSNVETLTKHVLPFLLGSLAVSLMMRIALRSIDAYGESFVGLRATAGIGKAITWIVGLALLAVLGSDALGISLAPALTALGVGSLAVALALQDTLSNFFSGVYLLLDKPIRIGDFIRLAEGQEGYVETISWRSTHLRTLAPSLVIVPNATLSKAVITNFRAANPRLFIGTPIEVAFDADPVAVERILSDEATRAKDIAGIDTTAAITVRLAPGQTDRGLVFTVYLTIKPETDASFVQQELRKRILPRLRSEGIGLASPVGFVRRA
jgi:small-conductance mechanosensitive channel